MRAKKLPKRLLDLTDPPRELYYTGDWQDEIFNKCVAVVGSRKMTEYGRQVIEKLILQLVFEGKTIVSGFMYGVDQYAHKLCMENGGKTIAVLGWGIEVPLDERDKKLAKDITSGGGLLISEWRDLKANLWTFPRRNRIVAALSSEVYVIEAGADSGSLITAKLALKLKRKLFAVPGPITSKTSVGTNALIASGKAEMWLGQNKQEKIDFDNPLLEQIGREPMTASELARKLEKDVSILGAELSILSLSGKVVDRGGKYYLANAG